MRQGLKLDSLAKVAPFLPYAQYFTIFAITSVVIADIVFTFMHGNGIVDSLTHVSASYVNIVLFVVLFVLYKAINGTRVVPLEEADFQSGSIVTEKMLSISKSLYLPDFPFEEKHSKNLHLEMEK